MAITSENLTTIAISKKNHRALSKLGRKGQSFDEVLTSVLDRVIEPQREQEPGNKNLRQQKLRVDRSSALVAEDLDNQIALRSDYDHE